MSHHHNHGVNWFPQQINFGVSAGPAISIGFSSGTPANGDLVVVASASNSTGTSSVTSTGATWTKINASGWVELFYSTNMTTTSATWDPPGASGNDAVAIIVWFKGNRVASVLDASSFLDNSPLPTATSVTPLTPNDLLFSGFASFGGARTGVPTGLTVPGEAFNLSSGTHLSVAYGVIRDLNPVTPVWNSANVSGVTNGLFKPF